MPIKIVCISDTHSRVHPSSIPHGDILIVAGDVSFNGSLKAIHAADQFLAALPHKYKIIVGGNHDIGIDLQQLKFFAENYPDYCSAELLDKTDYIKSILSKYIYLCDSSVTIEGIKFWGTPYTIGQRGAFSYDEDEMDLHAKLIPPDTDILITHSPPYGILDITQKAKNVGSKSLAKRVASIPKLKYHIFGHIHESHGVLTVKGVTFMNVAICDSKFKPTQSPMIIEIPK